ncbi:MAG: beta-galactosidase, partial [Muribaculaceae bacterium]|nr:beta-galactosidase [Muribaculaceae bacterium]
AEKLVLSEDYAGDDLIYVKVEVADKDGQMVPTANNDLKFSISGPGKIVACDAGDPTSHIPFYSKELPAFNGLCSVIVERTGKGKITLKASSKGLKGGELAIR